MSQANKQLVLRAVDALNARDLDAIDELYHPDYVNHEASAGAPHGTAAARCTTAFLHGTFEDFRLEPFDVIAENDLVVIRGQAGGRHVGAIDGFQPSGRRFSVQHIHIFRVTDAKISEHWACRDDLGAARQMGIVPAPLEGTGMRRFRPTMPLRAIATMTPRRRRDPESAFETYARLAAASGPWMLWFGMPSFPTAHDRDRDGL